MLERIIKSSIAKRKAIYLMIIIVFVVASMRYQTTTKSLLPNAKFPYVSVYTYMSGASPSNMEKEVTNKIEQELNDLSDLVKMTSDSSYSSSLIVLKFNEDSNIDDKVRVVQTKLSNIKHSLPKKAENPIVEEYDINNSPVIMVELDNRLPYKDKKNIIKEAERNIKSISGVSKVKIQGLETKSIEVIPDIQKLNMFGITEIEIIEKIKSYNTSLPLGSMSIDGNKYNFQVESQLTSLEEIENTIIRKLDDKPVYIRDVSEVKLRDKKEISSYKIIEGRKTPTLLMSVYKKKSADTVSINKEVKSFVERYNKSNEYGVTLDTSLDISRYISKSISDVIGNALSGLLSVVVVLFFFIGIREALIASSVIPVTLISSFLLFDKFNITLNIFSIMGLIIALGMLVDNAIVVIEMIDEKKKEHKELSIKDIVVSSTTKVAPAILASTLTTVCALIPLAIMKGDTGSLIREIPLTASIAMAVSFLSSITITPILAVEFIKHDSKEKFKALVLGLITLSSIYAFSDNFKLTKLSFVAGAIVFVFAYIKLFTNKKSNALSVFYKYMHSLMHSKFKKAMVMLVTISLLFGSVSLLFSDYIKKEAMPESDDINKFGTIKLIKGSVLNDSKEVSDKINKYLIESGYVSKINYSYDDSNINYNIELVEKDNREAHSKEITRDFNRFISEIPDVRGRFSTGDEEEGGAPVSLRLLGSDRNKLNEASKIVLKELKEIDGVIDPRINFDYSRPTFDIVTNNNRCEIYGVAPMDVMLKLRYLTSGEEVISIDEKGQNIKVFLQYHSPFYNVENLENIFILNEKQQNIPLLELVDIEETRFNSTLKHYEGKNTISVVADKKADANTNIITKDLIERIKGKLPENITYKLSGESESMEKSFKDLAEKMMIASILVYIVLVVQFNSYTQPFAIVLSIPYAIIGVVLGYFIFDLTFSTLSFLGIVALVGIAVNDAIVLIDYINTLRKELKMGNIESIIEGAKSRFNPIIATSLTTIAGVLPLAIYNEDYSGVAYSLIFGLIFSTILTLVVVPITLNIIEFVTYKFRKGEKLNV